MYQALLDRFADVLFPVLAGFAVWFGVHYFFLTERIMKVEMPLTYEVIEQNAQHIPSEVHTCLKSNYADAMMAVGSLEAALYTASLKHINQPFRKKSVEALDYLDNDCGTTKALEAEKERQRLAAEQREKAERERLQALKEEKLRHAERLRQKAIDEARRKQLKIYCDMANMFIGRELC